MALGVPSTNPLSILYTDGRIARTRNGQNATDLGGTNYISIQTANPVINTVSKSSVLYTQVASNTPVTGNVAISSPPNGPGTPSLQSNALSYSGLWGGVTSAGTALRVKLFGIYSSTGTPTIAMEGGVILNGATPTYTALAASTAFTLGAVTTQPWELNYDILVTNTPTGTSGSGTGFTGTVNVTAGAITSVTITAGGSGYVGLPTFASSGSSGAILIPTLANGAIVGIVVVAGGTGATQGNAITASTTSGSIFTRGQLILGGAAGAASTVLGLAPTATSIDTTASYILDARVTWSVAAAGNTIVCQGGYVEFLN